MAATPVVPAPSVQRRLAASLGDLAIIAGVIGAATAVGAVAQLFLDELAGPPSPTATDAVAFVATVLPVGIYLVTGEAGRHQAAWGKRRAGLRVVTADGGRPGLGRIVLRTAVKLLPWQLAHVAVARFILGVDDPVTTWSTYVLSLLVAAVSIAMALRDGRRRALHDRVAGTVVAAAR